MAELRTLKKGLKGPDVEQWQYFLIGDEYRCFASAEFDDFTYNATVQFQLDNKLSADGIVGSGTYTKAAELGFEPLASPDVDEDDETQNATTGDANWPYKPDKVWALSGEKAEAMFGKIEFDDSFGDNIEIVNGWDKKNIVKVTIPQLNKIGQSWGHSNGEILFNKKAAKQLIDLWDAWEKEGLLHHVISWSGSYCPRYIRGRRGIRVSMHAYGAAFDINVQWNKLGQRPALKGEKGSVRELVETAYKHGFYWGGHFKRKDGMHFEINKLI